VTSVMIWILFDVNKNSILLVFPVLFSPSLFSLDLSYGEKISVPARSARRSRNKLRLRIPQEPERTEVFSSSLVLVVLRSGSDVPFDFYFDCCRVKSVLFLSYRIKNSKFSNPN
jgi:hypothetical protein